MPESVIGSPVLPLMESVPALVIVADADIEPDADIVTVASVSVPVSVSDDPSSAGSEPGHAQSKTTTPSNKLRSGIKLPSPDGTEGR